MGLTRRTWAGLSTLAVILAMVALFVDAPAHGSPGAAPEPGWSVRPVPAAARGAGRMPSTSPSASILPSTSSVPVTGTLPATIPASTAAGSPQAAWGTDPTAASRGTGCPTPAPGLVRDAPGAGRTVALTFDDGPDSATPALLDILAREHVHATFFVIGSHAASRPDLVAREAAEGHLVADHTWSHSYPAQLRGGWRAAYLDGQLTRTNRAITAAAGQQVCWFRPPGGFMPSTVLPAAHRLDMNVVLWTVDPQDWKLQAHGASRRVSDLIVGRVGAGLSQQHPVILMHDGGGDRRAGVAAVARIISNYRAHGYRFVRLDGRP